VWTAKQGSQTIPRRILAATDVSDDVGRRVVEHAQRYRALFDAELHVLHACSLSMGEALLGGDKELQLDRQRRLAQAVVTEVCGSDAEHVTLHTPTAEALSAVCDAADTLDVDLVVMGTLSRRGVAGLLIGNTAERVVTRLDRSLLTIKPADFSTLR
jgi:nucleotide-binding universal stress UspA family protein